MWYEPSSEILAKYADLLVNFALWWGEWINAGDVVNIVIPDTAKLFLPHLVEAVYSAWGHPMVEYTPIDIDETKLNSATIDQLWYVPENVIKEKIKTINHNLSIHAPICEKIETEDKEEKIFASSSAKRETLILRREYEISRTVWLYWTRDKAKEVWLSYKKYRGQIIEACYLTASNPIKQWKKFKEDQDRIRERLDDLAIERLHIEGDWINLEVQLWENRKWLGRSGHNIPSFELFISPDWKWTNGEISFNTPLYTHGEKIEWISLIFENGEVTTAKATNNQELLYKIIETENGNKIGEFSLTDKRFSNISHPMWITLYDENLWWEYGNTHIALGRAYKESYRWSTTHPSPSEWEDMWFNDSAIHVDLISTQDRKVTALCRNGEEIEIYSHWTFCYQL